MKKISTHDYRVILCPFPNGVKGCVRLDSDDFASIYINQHLTAEEQRKTFEHEIRHLYHGDFSNGTPLADAEERAR